MKKFIMAIFKITRENKSIFEDEKFSRKIRADRAYTDEQIESLKPQMIHRFRCCDDDGEIYFHGVCSDDSSFAPLDCVGYMYGCTYIEYKNANGKYEEL